MKIQEGYYYSKSHEWVNFLEGNRAKIGLTDFAQNSLTDVVFVNLGEEGDVYEKEDMLGDIESIKAVSDILTPIAGTLLKVNEAVLDSPELVNSAPYEAWLVELETEDDESGLMSASEYEAYLKEVE